MGLQHRTLPLTGVQFHPESVLTEGGHRLLANWLEVCGMPDAEARSAGLSPLVRASSRVTPRASSGGGAGAGPVETKIVTGWPEAERDVGVGALREDHARGLSVRRLRSSPSP